MTQAQFNAALRYVSGYVATGGAVVVTIGLLPADQAHAIVDTMQKVLTDLKQLVGDSYLLAGLVLPIVMGIITRIGWKSASPEKQAASVNSLEHASVVTTDPKLAAAAGVPLVVELPETTK